MTKLSRIAAQIWEDSPTSFPHSICLPLNSCSISTTSPTSGASSLCSILTNFDYSNLHKQLSTAKGSFTMDSDAPVSLVNFSASRSVYQVTLGPLDTVCL